MASHHSNKPIHSVSAENSENQHETKTKRAIKMEALTVAMGGMKSETFSSLDDITIEVVKHIGDEG